MLATWRKAPFSATASYTYVRSSELSPAAGRAEVPLTPRHSFGLVGMWEKEGVARFGVECYYTGQQRLEYNPYRAFSSPYVIFGAMGERKVAAHVKLFLNLENLGNVRQSHWDPLLLPQPRGGWAMDGGCLGAAGRPGDQWRRPVCVLTSQRIPVGMSKSAGPERHWYEGDANEIHSDGICERELRGPR